jgi:hypothetical protein
MTKRDREKKKRERARVAHEESLVRKLCAEKAEDRFDGAIDTATGIWKIRGEKFDKDELVLLDALKEANPRVAVNLIDAYHQGDWSNSRNLQGYMSGAKAR